MLSIVIPAYNSEKDIETLLRSVLRTELADYEVIVADDGSSDRTPDICAGRERVSVVRLGRNRGPACARNEGAVRARGEVLVFIDTDVLLPDDVDVLSEIDGVFRRKPQVDCVATISHVRPLVENAIAYNNSVYHAYYMDRLLGGQPSREGRFMLFTTRLGAIRREKFRAAGGFHESLYTVMAEDAEFASRCHGLGFTSYVDRRLYHRHRYPTSFRRFARSYYLAATVKALVSRKTDTSADATVSPAEKFRRLYALGLLASPAALAVLDPGAWLGAMLPALLGFVLSFGRMLPLIWRNVPKRTLVPWFAAYVLITPAVLAGYARGLLLHLMGTPLLRGRSSTHPYFRTEASA